MDINDNFPVFSHEVFVGSIEELSETGNFILFFFLLVFPKMCKGTSGYALWSSLSAVTKAHSLADISQVIPV